MRHSLVLMASLVGVGEAFHAPSSALAGRAALARSALAPAAHSCSMEVKQPRRDEKGYIIPDDLDFDLRAGVSKELGASKLKEVPPPIEELLEKARSAPDSLMFAETIDAIDKAFEFFGTRFVNGAVESKDTENQGSSKVLSLAKLFDLPTDVVLSLFGEHYRAVKQDPSGSDHANIRALMQTGVEAVTFPNGLSLTPRKGSWDGTKYSSDSGLAESATVQGEAEWDVESDIWIP